MIVILFPALLFAVVVAAVALLQRSLPAPPPPRQQSVEVVFKFDTREFQAALRRASRAMKDLQMAIGRVEPTFNQASEAFKKVSVRASVPRRDGV